MWIRPGEAPASRPPTSGISAKRPRTRKAFWVYELDPTWRAQMHEHTAQRLPKLAPHEGLDQDTWIQQEFGQADLSDRRLSARLVKSATGLRVLGRPSCTANVEPSEAVSLKQIPPHGGYQTA